MYEAISFRSLEILNSLYKDSKIEIKSLKVDGGMTSSEEFLQTLADVSQTKVMKSKEQQITILGAAVAAGLHSKVGLWKDFEELKKFSQHEQNYNSLWRREVQIKKFEKWTKAIERTKDWI